MNSTSGCARDGNKPAVSADQAEAAPEEARRAQEDLEADQAVALRVAGSADLVASAEAVVGVGQ